MKSPILLTCFVFFLKYPLFGQMETDNSGMTNQKMEEILRNNAAEVKGQLGNWEAYVANKTVYIITDESHNRMRIVSPIVESKELD